MLEKSYDLPMKIIRAFPKRSEGGLQDIVGKNFMRLSEGNESEFQKKKASGVLSAAFPTIDEKEDVHRIMTEVKPLLGASGYQTRRKILMNHGEYPCADVMVPQARETGVSMGHRGVVLHGVAIPKPASVDRGS